MAGRGFYRYIHGLDGMERGANITQEGVYFLLTWWWWCCQIDQTPTSNVFDEVLRAFVHYLLIVIDCHQGGVNQAGSRLKSVGIMRRHTSAAAMRVRNLLPVCYIYIYIWVRWTDLAVVAQKNRMYRL